MSLQYKSQRKIDGEYVDFFETTGDHRLWRAVRNGDPVPHGDQEVIVGHGDPCPASEYDSLRLPGGVPFLRGIAALMPVYILAEGGNKNALRELPRVKRGDHG